IIELSHVQVRKSKFRRDYGHDWDVFFLPQSVINLNHGQFICANVITTEVDVPIQLVPQFIGIIFVSGWLKLTFAEINNGGLRYGKGLIVDGNYKIKVHVHPFVQNQGLIEGCYVRVRGKFCRNHNGIPFVSVNIQDVILVPNRAMAQFLQLH
ncbi:Protein of unknown function, partial [Cotesia congregata]